VQADARAAQAEVISSDTFSVILKQARASSPKPTENRKLSSQEVEEWLKLFGQKKRK
jgi:hypothetical protein